MTAPGSCNHLKGAQARKPDGSGDRATILNDVLRREEARGASRRKENAIENMEEDGHLDEENGVQIMETAGQLEEENGVRTKEQDGVDDR